MELTYTLVSDGSSDRALLNILSWLLREHSQENAFTGQWADPSRFPRSPKGFADKIALALEYFPCDLLFVHRDAESRERGVMMSRLLEIGEATNAVATATSIPYVSVVPVTMMEAWLLIDELALRRAADNPNGRIALNMPSVATIESIPNPKEILYALLRQACGLSGRRLKQFSESKRVHRVASLIDDFSALRHLSAFRAMERELKAVLKRSGWE